MLEKLYRYQDRLLSSFHIGYRRYLFNQIDFRDRMVAIFGARGVGKTTMLLQYLTDLLSGGKKALYISLDYPFLSGVELVDLVERFVSEGGEYLLLDEVHRYRDFAAHLKSVYDLFDVHVVFTGSSAASILEARSDLSRRVTLYHLAGFSFREFLELKRGVSLSAFGLEEILASHEGIAVDVLKKVPNLPEEFDEYLKVGYYPFYFEKEHAYYQLLLNTINLTIDLDLTSLGLVEQKYTYKLKKLLEVVCESEPFEVNYTKIAAMAEISRAKLYDYITYLRDAQLLLLVEPSAKGLKKMLKPAKIYLNNTNLLYAYCESSTKGTVRETFFANQVSQRYPLKSAKVGDFLVSDRYTFEIGGKKKGFKQIKEISDSFVAADGIVQGKDRKIPLWIFGLLY